MENANLDMMSDTKGTMDQLTEVSKNSINPERWVAVYGQALSRYALHRLRNIDLAEDIIQETYASALNSIKYFRGASSEKTWLFSILKHKISDHFRSMKIRNRQIPEVFSEQTPVDISFTYQMMSTDPCQEYERKEFFEFVQNAMFQLPRPIALAFYLYELKGLPKDEICRLMDIKTGNFYVRLFRARKQIRQYLRVKWFEA